MNFYEILQCPENATQDKLRENYLRLAKEFHPDKQTQNSAIKKNTENFIKLDEAWKTLNDVNKRKSYDNMLMRNIVEEDVYIERNVALSEVLITDIICRCGSYFIIDVKEFETEKEVIIGCEDCTNHILVYADKS